MDVGIGLPNAVPGASGEQLAEYARRADEAGFSTLGTIDRLVYPNYESFTSLAAAAAVTERIALATTILIAPYRLNAALLAKQAASVQRLSGGRLALGIAPGAREDDYEASGADFHTRGKVFDRMLEEMTSIWARSDGSGNTIGPDVAANPPELVLGGAVDASFRRAARYGSGWIMGGGTPEMFADGRANLEAAWSDAGREGKPKGRALAYFALGDTAEEDARNALGDYYAWLGEYAEQIVASAAKDPDTIRGYLQAFEEAGCDELILFPCSPDPAQVDLLAEAALG